MSCAPLSEAQVVWAVVGVATPAADQPMLAVAALAQLPCSATRAEVLSWPSSQATTTCR